MFLLDASNTRIYSSAVLEAILLLATLDAYLCERISPVHYTYGWPKAGDWRTHRYVNMAESYWGAITYKTRLTMRHRINCITIIDYAANRPRIWLSENPPCYNPDITITSPVSQKIDVKIDVYVER